MSRKSLYIASLSPEHESTNISCRHIWEAIRQIWPHAHWPGQHHMDMLESRL